MAQEGASTATAAERDPEPVTPGTADRTVVCVDNGGRPFAVHISYGRSVATLCKVTDEDGAKEAHDVIRSFQFRRVFIGLDPREPEGQQQRTGAASGPYGAFEKAIWWFGGNSVLLDLAGSDEDRRYVFAGFRILSFRTAPGDEIREYVSRMGNNCVPYPYAVGERNTYFPMDLTYVPNDIISQASPELQEDPYDVLYDESIARWLPPPATEQQEGAPKPHFLGAWCRAHPLRDVQVIAERVW